MVSHDSYHYLSSKGCAKTKIMSADSESADEVCASCGKAEVAVDDTKLKKCACNLVKYCSVDCQKNHRPQHKKACKKRMAAIRDDQLFTQPGESDLGDCPICCLPLPLDRKKSKMNSCCCKLICKGCNHANKMREAEQGLKQKCPYCREPLPDTDEEIDKNYMERVKANDPAAFSQVGFKCFKEEDYEGAFQYWRKAAKLGDMDAHYNLSCLYHKGEGVERDPKKEWYQYHLEEAAIGGHPDARFNLGCYEGNAGRHDRAMKHFIYLPNLDMTRHWKR